MRLGVLIAMFGFAGSAFSQMVVNGTHVIPCTSSITLNPSYRSESLDLTCPITSVTIPAGVAGESFLLAVKQDGGTVTGISSMMTGATTPNPTGITNFYMLWSEPLGSWAVSKSPVTVPTALSQLTNDVGFALATAVTAETTRAQGAEGTNATAVSTEATTRATADTTETTRATGAEGSLNSALATETTARLAGDTATVPLSRLAASSITVNGTSVPLGGSVSLATYLSGTSTSVSQAVLTVGSTATGTATISGVAAGTPCEAAPSNGSTNTGVNVRAFGTATNTVTVWQTNLVLLTTAPSTTTYNVRCFP